MSNIRQLVYKDPNGNLINATSVVLSSADSSYGIKNMTTGEVVVAAGTATSNVSTGIYQYDVSNLPSGVNYQLVWKVVYNGKTNYYPITFTVEQLVLTGDVGYTVEELVKKAEGIVEESIDTTDDDIKVFILGAVNDFSDDIAKTLPPLTSQTYSAQADTWYTLPADLIEIDKVEIGNYKTYSYDVRETYPAKIKFSSTGTYEVWYLKVPYKVTTLTNKPDMHPYLHGAGALFIASRFKAREDDENPDSQRLWQEYLMDKAERIKRLNNPSGRYKVVEDVLGGWR
ncbi:MAG TPA: hypothetical protein VEA37_07190 [Flavobacterium sp.]|nr:hypothetical protein [Flavobacterium sp.]